jgi:APA family basic amino acid/polyamine antiporter
LGPFSLTALAIGNMLGAGVFTTSGFALADLGSPQYVLLAWFIGGCLAMCGAASYGALARLMPVSGGEYFYLSRVVHPMVGFVAGWVSLWAGFTAAIAYSAITFEVYLLPPAWHSTLPENAIAIALILVAAAVHGLNVEGGVLLQNTVVIFKLALICAFILFAFGNAEPGTWPGVDAWRDSESSPFSLPDFAATLMWISFSYSGFNASIYVASEVRDATNSVPRSMLCATALIMILYLLLNAIFLLAPAPNVIAGEEDIAALAAQALAGEGMENLVRGMVAVAMLTSVSAMIMTGPRVYAQMARDGLMPALLRFEGKAPGAAVCAQALLAITVVCLSGLRELLSYLGFTLGLSTVVTIASLFAVARGRSSEVRNFPGYPWAPIVFIVFTLLFTGLAAVANPWEMLAALLTITSALLVYAVFGRNHRIQSLERGSSEVPR